jgi:hypothetical protein
MFDLPKRNDFSSRKIEDGLVDSVRLIRRLAIGIAASYSGVTRRIRRRFPEIENMTESIRK